MSDQVTTVDPSQQVPQGWFVGDLQDATTSGLWTKSLTTPHVEEFIPPNPPQSIGEGNKKTAVWPGPARYHGQPSFSGGGSGMVQDASNVTHFPFFRQQVLKQKEKVSFASGATVGRNT